MHLVFEGLQVTSNMKVRDAKVVNILMNIPMWHLILPLWYIP